MSYVNNISYVNNMSYMSYISYVNHMSIFINRLNSLAFCFLKNLELFS